MKKKYNIVDKEEGEGVMKQGFLKRNMFFIILLCILLIISLSLFGYMYVQKFITTSTSTSTNGETRQTTTSINDATIIEFEGSYSRSTQMIKLEWSYQKNHADIKQIKIYLDSQELVTVTSYTSYELSREQYDIPTGDNVFTLSIEQIDGTIVKQDCTIFVDYVLSAEQSVEDSQGLSKITLTYQYLEQQPVDPPRMILLDSDISYLSTYDAGTNIIKIENGIVTAQTTYGIEWNVYQAQGELNEQYSIRWSFKDIADSMDFTVNWNADSVLETNNDDED